jgi:TP901 family phage tail tape measure protein
MNENPNNLVENIELRTVAPRVPLPGLDDAIKKLERLDAALGTVNNRLAGLTTGSAFKLSAAQFAAKIPTSGPQSVRTLAKLWGFPDVKDVQNMAREVETELQRSIDRLKRKLDKTPVSPTGSSRARTALEKQIKELQAQSLFTDPTAEMLKNPTRAGQFAELYAKRALSDQVNARKAILALLSGTTQASAQQAAQMFPVQPPVSGGGAAKNAAAAAAAAGAKAGTTAAAKGSRGAGGAFAEALEKIKLDLARALNTGDLAMVSAAQRKAADQVQALVASDTEGKVKQITKDKALRYAADQERKSVESQQAFLSGESKNTFLTRKKLEEAERKGQKDKAKRLQEELREADRAQELERLGRRGGSGAIDQQAALAMEDVKHHEQEALRQEGLRRRAAVLKAIQDFQARGGEIFPGQRMGPNGEEGRFRGRLRLADGSYRMLNARVTADDAKIETYLRPSGSRGPKDRLQSAMEGMSLRNMTANVLKVTEWAAAVGVLYKSLELAEYTLKRLVDTGMEMAHLGIVFRGVGGSVKELTNDLIGLAAQQGRETSETMESAVEWARLGGDRKTILEEVRVSAEAANIANMHMGETTKQLMSLMHIYHLEAGDLNVTLGMLVNTSLKYNVTLEELFTGLDRSAAAAKVAGLGLAELQAMIGVVTGATGQTGSMTGSSLKYIFQELNKADVQRQLRGFGVESLGNNLEQKSAGQIFGELHGIWGTLGKRSQQQLSGLLGGRFNAARVPIVIEDYPQVLKLAVDAQLNLNKAQDANAKILESLRAQLAGIRAEWDRLAMSGNILSAVTKATAFAKNILHDATDRISGPGPSSQQNLSNRQELQGLGATDPWSWKRQQGVGRLAYRTLWSVVPSWVGLGLDKDLRNGPGLVDFYNYMHEDVPASGQNQFEDKLADIRKNMGANALRLQGFGLAQTTIRNGTMTGPNATAYAEMMQSMPGGQALASRFLAAFQGGNTRGELDVLGEARGQALQEQAASRQQEQLTLKTREIDLTVQQKKLQEEINAAVVNGSNHDQKDKELESVNQALQKTKQLVDDNSAAYEALEGDIANVQIEQEKYVALLKTQADILGEIQHFYTAIPAVTPAQALANQAAGLSAQVEALSAAADQFKQRPEYARGMPEAMQVYNEMLRQITEKEAERDSANDPVRQMQAQRLTDLLRGSRAAGNVARGADYGIDPTAKLLQQRKALMEDMAAVQERLTRVGIGSAEQAELAGRYLEDQNRVYQIGVSLAERRADVEREIHQLIIDQGKEFTRSFLGAGPSEMLRKLTALRLAFNPDGTRRPGMSQGAFFSMSPEMRGDYGMLNPAFNSQMLELQNERRRLGLPDPNGGAGPGAGEAPTKVPDWLGKIQGEIVRSTTATAAAGLTLKSMLERAANVMDASATRFSRALDGLSVKLETMSQAHKAAAAGAQSGYHAPVSPQTMGIGGGRGYSVWSPGVVGH